MKKALFLISFLVVFNLSAQWKTNKGSNKFDGSYKLASVIGTGGEWPYTKPTLVINRFEESEPEIYLTNIGYTGCSNNNIRVSFDGENDILICDNTGTNLENDAVFINYFSNISFPDFINSLKSKNKVYIRFSNSCGQNDYVFGLQGSSKAINFVVGEYYYLDETEEDDFIHQYVDFIEGFKCGDRMNPKVNAFYLYVTKPITTLTIDNEEFVITNKDKLQFFNLFDLYGNKRVYVKIWGETGSLRKEVLISREECLLISEDPRIKVMFDYLNEIKTLQSNCTE